MEGAVSEINVIGEYMLVVGIDSNSVAIITDTIYEEFITFLFEFTPRSESLPVNH